MKTVSHVQPRAPHLALYLCPSYLELSFVTNDVEGCTLWAQKARVRWGSVGVGGTEEISAS